MTTYADIVAFVKAQARIVTSSQDTLLQAQINDSYERMCRKAAGIGWPGLRKTATFTTSATQEYNLATDFDRLIEDSVRYYTSGQTNFTILDIVVGSDGEIWDSMQTQYAPSACRVVAGSTGTQRKLRLLPNFTETGKTVAYAYYRRPAALSGSAVLELPELASAVAWDVMAMNKDYGRDSDRSQEIYMARAKAAFREAMGTILQ